MLKNSDTESGYWFVVSGSEIWVIDDGIPFGTAAELKLPYEHAVRIGTYQGSPAYWINEAEVSEVLPMRSLRDMLNMQEALFLTASKAVQYGHMTQSMRFCPQCGGRNHFNHDQLAMQCDDCRTLHYPRIYPCIIVAVRKDNQILLAQHSGHRNGMYTVIAGFLEVGETLEQCVAREIKEETGIDVHNVQYFGSQPWAFPSSMMMGFLADYAGGDIHPDYSELKDAAWFSIDQLPEVASEGTIARALIEHTLEKIRQDIK